MSSKLTNKQKMFCKEYLIDLNATQAAIRAGYSENTAKEIGCENLTKPNIQEEIQKLMNERAKRVEIDADYVLSKFKKIADDDITNYLSFATKPVLVGYDRKDGEPKPIYEDRIVVEVKDSDEIDTWNISEVSIGKDGQFKFKTHCKDNALIQLGKHLKLFTDKVEVKADQNITVKFDIPRPKE